jgi:pimeloyl-ACP methyl ester carboxylesterase
MTRPPRSTTVRIAITALVCYVAVLAMLIIGESTFVYQSFPGPTDPTEAGVPAYAKHTLEVDNLPPIVYWETEGREAFPTLLYFHGNGGGLHAHVPMLNALAQQKFDIIAIEYPGYPGAEGRPSEALLVAQAQALYDHVAAYGEDVPIVWGYSLGSGVATQLAASRKVHALVLEAPFTAIVDRAAEMFPIFPVHRVMRNRYASRDVIASIGAPLLILHGDADIIVPISHGRALYAFAAEPKSLKEYPGFGHLDLFESPAYADAAAFLAGVQR